MTRQLLSSVWKRLRGLREREQPDPLYCPAARQDPYPYYQRLRETDPVHCIAGKGVWTVARTEHVEEVLGRPDLYLSSELHNVEQSLQGADDPGHSRVRKILSRVLNPKRMAEWEGPIRKLTEGFIARAAEQGHSEFVGEIATPLPLQVVSLVLDFDLDRWEDYNRWSEAGVADEFAGLDRVKRTCVDKSLAELDAFLTGHLARCRRGEAGGAFNTEVVPDLTDQEAMDVFRILLIAGNVTTKHLIGNIAVALAQHPGLLAQLRRDPSLIPAMVEETLRINGPTLSIARRTAKETRLGGVTLPANSPIFIYSSCWVLPTGKGTASPNPMQSTSSAASVTSPSATGYISASAPRSVGSKLVSSSNPCSRNGSPSRRCGPSMKSSGIRTLTCEGPRALS